MYIIPKVPLTMADGSGGRKLADGSWKVTRVAGKWLAAIVSSSEQQLGAVEIDDDKGILGFFT